VPAWTRGVGRLPEGVANALLETFDALARRLPGLADVILLVGRPRRPALPLLAEPSS
jgi:hypothetical protein